MKSVKSLTHVENIMKSVQSLTHVENTMKSVKSLTHVENIMKSVKSLTHVENFLLIFLILSGVQNFGKFMLKRFRICNGLLAFSNDLLEIFNCLLLPDRITAYNVRPITQNLNHKLHCYAILEFKETVRG